MSATNPSQSASSSLLHYIGVDVGTGSARACIIDSKGELVGHASGNIQTWQPRPGFYEQSTDDIWRVICAVVREAILKSGIEPHTVASIAFAATCSLAVHTHDSDEPSEMSGVASSGDVHNILLWMNSCADVEAAFVNSQKHDLLKYLGGSIGALMELPKLMWLRNNTPEEIFNRYRFFNLNDSLTHIATGNATIPCTAACKVESSSLGVGVDGTIKGWDRNFLVEIDLQILTENEFKQHGNYPAAGSPVSKLCEKAAQELGLPSDVIVGSGIIDSYAGWVGTVGAQLDGQENWETFPVQSRLALVAGTSSCLIAASIAPIFVNGIWGPYKDWVLPGFWISEGHQPASGQLLQQVLRDHLYYEDATSLAEAQGPDIFNFLNEHLQKMQAVSKAPSIPNLARDVFFIGDRVVNKANAEMLLVGVKNLDSLALSYYSVMEFLAFQIHQMISKMNKAGHTITSIFMSGSQCQNSILVDTIATACNLPVVIPRYQDAAVCYGAALLAVKASTVDEDDGTEGLWSIMQRLSKTGRVMQPSADGDVRELLGWKYKEFLEGPENRERASR